MVICWIYRTANKKRKKILAHNVTAEYQLLKENYKKDQLIKFLEQELHNNA